MLKIFFSSIVAGDYNKPRMVWLYQRITSVFLTFLMIWLLFEGLGKTGDMGYDEFNLWLLNPFNASLLALTNIFIFWHMAIGLEVIIEDYIHHHFWHLFFKKSIQLGARFFMILGVVSILFVYVR